MKAATGYRLTIGLVIVGSLVFGWPLLPTRVWAEERGYGEAAETYSREELAQMLAPIALYPDTLLSQVLMASTYPIEVIEAERWRKDHSYLQDVALDQALEAKPWDPSVKALVHVPSVLSLMSERISETTTIGNAFLAQEEQVLDMVQELRAAAYAEGNLTADGRQTLVVQNQTFIIEPANPRIIYVPYYDPLTIYGPWRYRAYPPYYWAPSRARFGVGLSYWPGLSFSFSYGQWSYFDWPRRYVTIDVHKRPRYVSKDRWRTSSGRWQHIPSHRRGVVYRDAPTARKYHQAPRIMDSPRELRGFPERQPTDRRQRTDYGRQQRTIEGQKRQQRSITNQNRTIREQIERDRKQREIILRNNRQQQRIDTIRHRKDAGDNRQPQGSRSADPTHKAQQTRTQRPAASDLRRAERQTHFNRGEERSLGRPSSQRGRTLRQENSGSPSRKEP